MVSSGARHALRVSGVAAVLAAFVVASLAPAAGLDLGAERHRQLLERVQEIIGLAGPHSADLLEPLANLIALYQEGNDDALAAVAIERAVQVVRINQGLHTLDQVPLIRQLIRIEEERGNHPAAWELEQDLLTLVRRYPDDLRTVPTLREVADRRMAVLGRYLGGQRPEEIILGCYYETWPLRDDANCQAGSRETVVQGMLAEAQRNYSAAIGALVRNGLYGSDELRDMELQLLRGVDLVRTRYGYDSDPRYGSTYQRGRQSLRRLYAYGVASTSPLLTQANAAVQLADWELLYSRHGVAVDAYQLAYDVLATTDVPRASREQLFAPPLPVVLPAFQRNPLARDETRPVTGHIDVEFEITKYGRGREVEILGATNATDVARDRLVSLIMTNRFRPRPMDGKFADSSRVVTRYYLYDTP
jgi:hypothetical protein